MFSRIGQLGAQPVLFPVLRAQARYPALIASEGRVDGDLLAVEENFARFSWGPTPKMARVVSVRPAPISPAKPTISPAYSEKLMSRTMRPALRCLTSKIFSPFWQVDARELLLDFSADHVGDDLRPSSVSTKFIDVMYCPSRMMVTRSTMCCNSSSRWEIYTMPQSGIAADCRMMRNSSSISFAVSAEVGSSMIRTLALMESALAISTICCLETGRSPTVSLGEMSMLRSSENPLGLRLHARARSRTGRLVPSHARGTCFLRRSGARHMFSSWWMIATPSACACFGVRSPYSLSENFNACRCLGYTRRLRFSSAWICPRRFRPAEP